MQKIMSVIMVLLATIVFLPSMPTGSQKGWEANKGHNNYRRQEPIPVIAIGSIEGRVLDKWRRPLGKILVRAEAEGHTRGRLAETRTNKEGRFAFYDLPIGKYIIYGGNEAEGYPESPTSFYQNERNVQNMEVLKDKSVSLTIVLGKKMGRIAGIVKDAVTRKPVKEAIIRLEVLKDRRRYLQTSLDDGATFKIAVPPDPVLFKVFAAGYQPYDQTGNSAGLRVVPGRVRSFSVYLIPVGK